EDSLRAEITTTYTPTEVKSTTIDCPPPPPPPDENPNYDASPAEENDIDYNAKQEGVEWNDMQSFN
ncbi:MAG: hypothetical protein ACK55Z_02975, partial [bacterium]